MYDPNDYEAQGPQITARMGTKRRVKQARARLVFFTILRLNAEAELRRHERKMLETLPAQGNA